MTNTILFPDEIFSHYRESTEYFLFDFVIPPYAIINSVLNIVSTQPLYLITLHKLESSEDLLRTLHYWQASVNQSNHSMASRLLDLLTTLTVLYIITKRLICRQFMS